MMKKYITTLLMLLLIGGVTLAPISSVFAADDAKTEAPKGGEEEEPECD